MAQERDRRDIHQDEGTELPPDSIVFKWRIAVVSLLGLFALVWILFAMLGFD